MNISEHLSELEALRKERGMSQQELAETCGVSKATICRALNGATEPTARLVQSIEAAVQYTPEEHPVLPAPGQSMEEYVEQRSSARAMTTGGTPCSCKRTTAFSTARTAG